MNRTFHIAKASLYQFDLLYIGTRPHIAKTSLYQFDLLYIGARPEVRDPVFHDELFSVATFRVSIQA